jgi:membrane protein DedA with SNARE-associated domain
LTQLVEQYGYLAVFSLIALEALGIPLPGETTLITAALFAGATHELHIVAVIAAAAAGAIIGYSLSFMIGFWGGYRLLVRFGSLIRLDQPKVKLARYLFVRHGGKLVFFGRFVPILRAYGALLAGTLRMNPGRFFIFNALGGIAWTALYGGAAYFFGKEVERASRPVALVIGVIALVLMVIIVMVTRRYERQLEETAERAFPGPLPGYPGGEPL